MKTPLAVLAALALAGAATLMAQTPARQKPSWRTNNDDVVIENIDSQSIKGTGTRIEIDFAGTPLRGRSRPQNIAFTAQKLIGILVQNTTKAFYLDSGELSGNVQIVQNNPGTAVRTLRTARLTLKENAAQTTSTVTVPGTFTLDQEGGTTLRAGSGVLALVTQGATRQFQDLRLSGGYRAESVSTSAGVRRTSVATGDSAVVANPDNLGKVTSPGKLDIEVTDHTTQNDPTQNQKLTLRTGGGEILFPTSASGRPIRSADLKGRIVAVAETWTKPADGPPEPIEIEAQGDRLTFDQNGVMTLRGNVTLQINGPTGLKGTGNVLIIRFDENMNVLSWETSGVPGTLQGGGRR